MTAILLTAAAATVCAAALALAVALLLALAAALGAAFAWGWTPVAAARYEHRLKRRYEPLPPSQTSGRRHGRPQPDPAGVDADAYWTAAREASAAAAQPARDGLTQPAPVVEAGPWRPRTVGGGR